MMQGFRDGELLYSKKNRVLTCLYDGSGKSRKAVEKTFANARGFSVEWDIVQAIKGANIRIPEVLNIDKEKARIIYAYIAGETLLSYLEKWEMEDEPLKNQLLAESEKAIHDPSYEMIIDSLCDWLIDFYGYIKKITGKSVILGDIHLRNFIYSPSNGGIYGLDFEDCRPGSPETDIARLCVFILTYDPPYTKVKIRTAGNLLLRLSKGLALDQTRLRSEMNRELAELKERRGCRVRFDIVEELLSFTTRE